MNQRCAVRFCKQAVFGFLLLWIGVSARVRLAAQAADPLPSWNEGASKKAIIDFVTRSTTVGGADFIPVEERVATFREGTLWEQLNANEKCRYEPMLEVLS